MDAGTGQDSPLPPKSVHLQRKFNVNFLVLICEHNDGSLPGPGLLVGLLRILQRSAVEASAISQLVVNCCLLVTNTRCCCRARTRSANYSSRNNVRDRCRPCEALGATHGN